MVGIVFREAEWRNTVAAGSRVAGDVARRGAEGDEEGEPDWRSVCSVGKTRGGISCAEVDFASGTPVAGGYCC